MNPLDLENRFKFHPANATRAAEHERIREMCLDLALLLDDLCPDGRELSLAITNLEYVMFCANASIARQPD